MLRFGVGDNKSPLYVNPLNVYWIRERGTTKDGTPRTRITFESNWSVTVAESVESVQQRLSDWLDAHA